ncbi:hypothetical protein AAF712_001703 [Marasmius tenuissimus]|uniref:Uncharacterized protein n=1 Tax=Marasmius tenuissimus TaxID=585030 RepID=A0ABR3ABP8_9AGAR
MVARQFIVLLFLKLFTLVQGQTFTLNVVEKTSYPFATPGNTQEFEAAGTGTDGATTLLDRIRFSEYLVVDDSASTPFLSTATAVSTFTREYSSQFLSVHIPISSHFPSETFVAAGSSGYQIIYSPQETGAVAMIQSCSFQNQEKGECVEKDWLVGQSSTQTTTFTGRIVPYWTVTQLNAVSPTSTATNPQTTAKSGSDSNGGNQGNSALSMRISSLLPTMAVLLGISMTM